MESRVESTSLYFNNKEDMPAKIPKTRDNDLSTESMTTNKSECENWYMNISATVIALFFLALNHKKNTNIIMGESQL